MAELLIMNKKERQRKVILEQVLTGFIRKKDARKRLVLSSRQFRRIFSAYKQHGDVALVNKSRGKPSGRAYSADIKEKVLRLYREQYLDFGPTLAAEKLEEDDNLKVHP